MEFGSLKYGLLGCGDEIQGGVAIYITNIALYFYDNFCI